MTRPEQILKQSLDRLESKESYAENRRKRQYSQDMSSAIALAFSAELRERGLKEALPSPPASDGSSGVERRMSGGIGAKKVDVTWTTEESGLILSISIKTINWKDGRSGNFQKNLTNRRGDMLFESVTLHRRFPYGVLLGFLFLDEEAAADDTPLRNSTFHNAHHRLRMFTGRDDPAGREEQYERLYIALVNASPGASTFSFYQVGEPSRPVDLSDIFAEAISLVAARNGDFYEETDGKLTAI